jgi:hypothetical protein
MIRSHSFAALGALVIIGGLSGSASANGQYDPASAFISRLSGEEMPLHHVTSVGRSIGDPAADFIDTLGGKTVKVERRNVDAVTRQYNSNPARDFVEALGGKTFKVESRFE